MKSYLEDSLWTDSNRLRYFLIPDNQNLPDGEFTIYKVNGYEKKVDITALIVWEISQSEAREYLQADMNQALETAKNAFGDFMLFAAQTFQNSSEPSLVSSALKINPQELQNRPEIAKETTQNLYTELQDLLKEANLQNPQQVEIANSRIHSLQEELQSQGIDISAEMEQLTNKLQEVFASPSFQQNLPLILANLQNFLNNIDQSPEKLGETLDNLIQSISEDVLTAQEKILDEQRQQQYKQSAQEAIAQSFKKLDMPSLADGFLQLNIKQQEESALNLSSQTDVQQQETTPENGEHILTILTREEIGKFHEALQVLPRSRRRQAEEIIAKLKREINTRLGESGEEIFNQAHSFFSEVKIEIKNLKLIQRYSGLAHQTKSLLQMNDDNQQHGEISADVIFELENLFWSINNRLKELPTDNLKGSKELELLMEIEDFRYQLNSCERLILKNE
ncbi:MAG TPA: hypothetical protein VK184_10230 [Nostocaceae cyanobacterium]|nr:hypothetical protein [Nostocaceae cyanobacterium]